MVHPFSGRIVKSFETEVESAQAAKPAMQLALNAFGIVKQSAPRIAAVLFKKKT